MLRERLNEELKLAMKAKDSRVVSTVRLILAALKDRDIAARGKDRTEGIDENEILQMLQTMVKQRRESIAQYEKGGRLDLVQKEEAELAVLRRFLPQPLTEGEIRDLIQSSIDQLGAKGIQDLGRVMKQIMPQVTGRSDGKRVNELAREMLGT